MSYFKLVKSYILNDKKVSLNNHCKYEPGVWTFARVGRLFIFKDYQLASEYAYFMKNNLKNNCILNKYKSIYELWLSDAIDPRPLKYGCGSNLYADIVYYWNKGRFQKDYYKIRLPKGTYGAKAVKLIERIEI